MDPSDAGLLLLRAALAAEPCPRLSSTSSAILQQSSTGSEERPCARTAAAAACSSSPEDSRRRQQWPLNRTEPDREAAVCEVPTASSNGLPEINGSFIPPATFHELVGSEKCSICLETLQGKAIVVTVCGHMFHLSCLNAMQDPRCPHCRQPVDTGLLARRPDSETELIDFVSVLMISSYGLDMYAPPLQHPSMFSMPLGYPGVPATRPWPGIASMQSHVIPTVLPAMRPGSQPPLQRGRMWIV